MDASSRVTGFEGKVTLIMGALEQMLIRYNRLPSQDCSIAEFAQQAKIHLP